MRSRDHVRSALKDFVSCPECLKLALETDTLPYEIDTSPFETAPYDDPASVSLASSRMTAPRLGPALLKARCGRPPRTATFLARRGGSGVRKSRTWWLVCDARRAQRGTTLVLLEGFDSATSSFGLNTEKAAAERPKGIMNERRRTVYKPAWLVCRLQRSADNDR
jgi:hypothetical protein